MPNPPIETYEKEPWWPFITIALLAIAMVALALVGYEMYARVGELEKQNVDLSSQVQQLSADKEGLTTQVQSLTKQLAQLTCEGDWNGASCTPYPAFITAKTASGRSPLNETFTIRAKNPKYGIDFGDGTTSWLSAGSTAAEQCTPKDDGFCVFTVSHVYRSSATSTPSFDVRLLQGTTTAATTSVTLITS